MRSLSKTISRLGLTEETFVETVALFHIGDKWDVMALGIKVRNGYLYARIFRGSKTYSDIIDSQGLKITCRICITGNPITFYYSIFRKSALTRCYSEVKCVKRFCDAYIDAVIEDMRATDSYIEVFLKPTDISVVRRYPRGFNRASAAIIEALVHYTKMGYVDGDEKRKIVLRIEMCRETVYRSSEDPTYRKIIDRIAKQIGIKL